VSAEPWGSLSRSRRGLTSGDRALWLAWAQAAKVRPLPGQALPEAPPTPGPVASAPPSRIASASAPVKPSPPPELAVGTPLGGIDKHRWRDLSRGRTRPERVLDLHGRHAQDAHHAVRGFLLGAHADRLRCVAIITGKGGSEGGVLRRELPHWLNGPDLRPLLLGAAHPHPSNPGAVHLLLRRGAQRRS